jgi:hypothetical protein
LRRGRRGGTARHAHAVVAAKAAGVTSSRPPLALRACTQAHAHLPWRRAAWSGPFAPGGLVRSLRAGRLRPGDRTPGGLGWAIGRRASCERLCDLFTGWARPIDGTRSSAGCRIRSKCCPRFMYNVQCHLDSACSWTTWNFEDITVPPGDGSHQPFRASELVASKPLWHSATWLPTSPLLPSANPPPPPPPPAGQTCPTSSTAQHAGGAHLGRPGPVPSHALGAGRLQQRGAGHGRPRRIQVGWGG